MNPTVLCVIAHPDDEAFGPSGTLTKLAVTHDVHIACVTDGASEPRFNPLGSRLASIREDELRKSAEEIGAKEVHLLSYRDGSLCNNLYHEIADKLIVLCQAIKPTIIVTMELRGVSGHLDHVAVAMIASYVYQKLTFIDAILYHCTSREVSDSMRDYFVFFPHGFMRGQVDKIINIEDVFDKKVASARCHKSQIADVKRITQRWMELPKEEWFLVEKRRKINI